MFSTILSAGPRIGVAPTVSFSGGFDSAAGAGARAGAAAALFPSPWAVEAVPSSAVFDVIAPLSDREIELSLNSPEK